MRNYSPHANGYLRMRNYSPHANGYLRMRNYSPRPVLPVDRQTDGQTEKRQTIAVTLRLCFAARVNKRLVGYKPVKAPQAGQSGVNALVRNHKYTYTTRALPSCYSRDDNEKFLIWSFTLFSHLNKV